MRRGDLLIRLLLSALCLGVLACQAGAPERADMPEFEIDKQYSQGPVKYTLRLSRREISVVDQEHLQLEVQAPEDYEVSFPDLGSALGEFKVADYTSPPPRLGQAGMLVHQRNYLLEPFLAGEYKVPALVVIFRQSGQEQSLSSEELSVKVVSVLEEGDGELALKEIDAPLLMPRELRWWWWLVLVVAGALFVWWRRKRKEMHLTVEKIPAHQIAYNALNALLQSRLVEQGRVCEFYQELSNILRRYIEDRFGLRAPERTTEEFMADLACLDSPIASHKPLLKDFLRHCDLVKFAKYAPAEGEIQSALGACRKFISETEAPEEEL
ncbi:MAG: hypothetical protein GX589_09010 [Deltaproteobacteria bacterium]|nr:hypothetical protein [Deltaproteobacteria bacterium]